MRIYKWIKVAWLICTLFSIYLLFGVLSGPLLVEWQKEEDMKEIRETKYPSDFLIGYNVKK